MAPTPPVKRNGMVRVQQDEFLVIPTVWRPQGLGVAPAPPTESRGYGAHMRAAPSVMCCACGRHTVVIQWGGGGRRLTLVGTILLGLAKLPHVLLSKRRILGLNGSVGVRGRSGISLDAPNMSGTKKTGPYKSTVKMVIFFLAFGP